MIICPYARSLHVKCTTPFSAYVHVSMCNARIIQWLCRVVYFKTYVRYDRRNKTYMHDLAPRGNLSHMLCIYYVWVINQRKRKLKLWSWSSTMGNNSIIFTQFFKLGPFFRICAVRDKYDKRIVGIIISFPIKKNDIWNRPHSKNVYLGLGPNVLFPSINFRFTQIHIWNKEANLNLKKSKRAHVNCEKTDVRLGKDSPKAQSSNHC